MVMKKLITAGFASPLLLVIILHVAVASATADDPHLWVYNCSSTDGNYTNSSSYKTNLQSLFNKTTETDVEYGFYNFSAGQSPDVANLISLCLGNIDVTGCHTCQKFVIDQMINNLCPDQKTAIAWSDNCFVRYSNEAIFGVLAEEPSFRMLRTAKAPNDTPEEYINMVKTLLESLPGNASAGDSRLKFASAQAAFNSSITIYAAGQCTPDLTQKECLDCLGAANKQIQSCPECKGQRGARVLLPSCMVRFEEGKFYLSPDAPAPTTSPSPNVSSTPSNVSPSPSSTVNAAKKRTGSRSSLVAIAALGACLSAVL